MGFTSTYQHDRSLRSTDIHGSHLSHHLLAAYSLGCTPSLLKAAYDLHAEYQREQQPSRSEITEQNWKDHLGKPALVTSATAT